MSTLKEILTRRAVAATIRLTVPAEAARPAPPLGPSLGQYRLNLMAFSFLQGLQREGPEVQTGFSNGRHNHGLQGQHLRVHRQVCLRHLVPQKGFRSRVREQPPPPSRSSTSTRLPRLSSLIRIVSTCPWSPFVSQLRGRLILW
ncbi:54S ribosomal protein L19 mitochondrial [Tripterygium wilfordii]|uniref:54S ribosomal protein L19 mitochondrial n=1 Tax=Tripterygium wilfordii TaxID=458696 RepID=A0A7J7E3K4_TRIWF|nr:54S ribosomal protein L19 mitochondrial [Tripterygium wilfordii]